MIKTIIQKENPLLHSIAGPVSVREITERKIKNVIKDMRDTLSSTNDGVALAAPQIGIPLRIFVVSPRAFTGFDENKKLKDDKNTLERNRLPPEKKAENEHLVYINPKIVRLSSKKSTLHEGCLSVHTIYGEIRRSNKSLVEAYDEHGKKFSRGASGLLAEIFQHEVDHLNGILFIDSAINLREIKSESKNP